MDKNFNLDSVKIYIDGILVHQDTLSSYRKVAEDIYKTLAFKPYITVKDIEIYLRNSEMFAGVDSETAAFLASNNFAKDIKSLTMGTRSEEDVFWWAVATGIWVFGAIDKCNPMYRGGN